MSQQTAIIIGAGPAGLTVAYELLKHTNIKPVIYETSSHIGGIARTIDYKGNKIDIGGHRFFSKSDRVVKWWLDILPLQGAPSKDYAELGRHIQLSCEPDAPDPEKNDDVMLVRKRTSRIFYQRRFFDYPLTLNFKTLTNLNLVRLARIILSYIRARLFPIKNEKSLEDFFINRFGKELYKTFFRDYTEKVWGKPCSQIKPDWGAQRVKGLSVAGVIRHSLRTLLLKDSSMSQKKTETSLIEYFLYPKLGPGQLWDKVVRLIEEAGGNLYLNHTVTGLKHTDCKMAEVEVRNEITGEITTCPADYVFSSMPVRDLVVAMTNGIPDNVQQIAQGLLCRDFITVGLLLKELKIKNDTKTKTINDIIPDQWIYIQEKDVKIGRLQIFNNWSPYMVKDENTIWVGLEYFCNRGDELWGKSDEEFVHFAVEEMAKIGFIEKQDVIDSVIIRIPNVYPCYFGSYEHFGVVRNFLDKFENLFLIGRTGMHRYNNQDHSMLTAMTSVENVVNNISSKDNIWAVNVEQEYHERQKTDGKIEQ
ncbi:MAG: NAD(P)/FAD-dependent oxidoreductase [Planctomycetota bacterium]|jgi:protoporphyrinogen oxidase